MSYYYITSFFLFYSFLGWVLEVVYHVLCAGKVINRGFMNGPVCPIYGFGILSVLLILHPFLDNIPLLFLGGTVFATLIELFGGFILFRIFHMRWWDYSEEPFNLGGYICLRFSLAWGICIVFALKVIHPLVELNVTLLDGMFGHILVLVIWVIFFTDFVITVLTVMELNKDLEKMNRIAARMRRFSDGLTEKVGEGTMEADARIQEGRVQAALAKAELRDQAALAKAELRDQAALAKAELREQAAMIRRQTRYAYMGFQRIHKAFPRLQHKLYPAELSALIGQAGEDKDEKGQEKS